MGKNIKKYVELILFLGWFPFAIFYFYSPIETINIPSHLEISATKQWWVVLFKDKKIGYSYLEIAPTKDGYKIKDFLYMKLNALGNIKTLYSNLSGNTSKDFRIKSFSFSITTPSGVNFTGLGKYTKGKLNIKLKTPAGEESISLSSPTPPYLPDAIYLALAGKKLQMGKTYTFPLFDPLIGKEIQGRIKVIKKVPYRFMGSIISAYQLKFIYGNTTAESIFSPQLGVLEEKSGGGFILKRTTREEALKPVQNVNIIWSVAIKANKELEPTKISQITYKISGIDLSEFDLDGGVQDLEDNILIIKKAKVPVVNSIPSQKNLLPYLSATPFIQTGAPPFKSIVKKNRGNNVTETARNLTHWVYNYLEKTPVISVPSALDVLKMKKGDCNEHAVLLTALLRTAGIPTREVAGVVYQKGYFFYHAWVEIYLKSQWIPVDPTFDQFPADVTHIRFIIGGLNNQVKVLKMINRVKIEILDFRR